MTISPGQPAYDDDQWVRVITLPTYINADGTLNHQAFKFTPPKPEKNRAWNHEMSGRLLSQTKGLDGEAIGYVKYIRENMVRLGKKPAPAFGYYGHMATSPIAVRQIDPSNSEIVYTPMGADDPVPDQAHADLVLYKSETPIPAICSRLQDIMQIFSPDKTELLEAMK